jgi:hypothetical protein
VCLAVYCLPCSSKFLLHKVAVLRLVAVQLGQLLCHRPVRIIFPAFGIGIHNRASSPCDASLSPSWCSITAFTWAATQSHAVATITSDNAREVSCVSPACLVRGGDKNLRQRQRRVTTPPRPDGGAQWSLPQIGRSPAQLAQRRIQQCDHNRVQQPSLITDTSRSSSLSALPNYLSTLVLNSPITITIRHDDPDSH